MSSPEKIVEKAPNTHSRDKSIHRGIRHEFCLDSLEKDGYIRCGV